MHSIGFRHNWWVWATLAFLPAAAFLLLFGTGRLFPESTSWLANGDTLMNHAAWIYFQQTPVFQFPITAVPNYGTYPWSNITLADSIPVLALPLKLLGVLPVGGQYFGGWILLCMYLQLIWAFKLLQRFSKDDLQCICYAPIFMLASFFLARSGVLDDRVSHLALMAHWQILIALYLYFDVKARIVAWMVLALLSSLTHPYLLVLVVLIKGTHSLKQVVKLKHKPITEVPRFLLVALVPVASLFSQGYFTHTIDSSIGGYGRYRAGMATFFDSDNMWSSFLPDLPPQGNGEYEGAAYLGAGVLLSLMVLAFVTAVSKRLSVKKIGAEPLVWLCVVLFGVALSNVVSVGPFILFQFTLPDLIQYYADIFRSAGRFTWVVGYVLFVGIFAAVQQLASLKTARAVVLLILCVQCLDFVRPMQQMHAKAVYKSDMLVPSTDELLDTITLHDKVVILGDHYLTDVTTEVALRAGLVNVPVDQARLARYSDAYSRARLKEKNEKLSQLLYEPNALYVFDTVEKWDEARGRDPNKRPYSSIGGFFIYSDRL